METLDEWLVDGQAWRIVGEGDGGWKVEIPGRREPSQPLVVRALIERIRQLRTLRADE